MTKTKVFAIAALLGASISITSPAQAQALVVSAGYSAPSITLAPGALITIYVTGLNFAGQSISASSLPLPTTLGGVSVILTSPASSLVPDAPLFSVAGVPGAPQLTAITIEVPTEIYSGIAAGFAGTIAVSQNGILAASVPVLLVESNVQALNSAPLQSLKPQSAVRALSFAV